MKTKNTHIKNPSPEVLDFLRKYRDDKEKDKKETLSNWHKYFPKNS